ncbi:hypothetical protein MW887_007085 [Aspergillus wentii]|nr:hypothetical protein MW887_007085 [Aspergillus wentii]
MQASQSTSGAISQFCPHSILPDRFHTCIHPYHSPYSENNLPALLFRLDAPEPEDLPPVQILMEDDQPMRDIEGNPIRDFDFLPRFISTRPAPWLLEYWMRTDARLTYRDIKARMVGPTKDKPADNLLNMRREREARAPLALSCWNTRRGNLTRVEVERVERWSEDQLTYNTTMIVEYSGPTADSQSVPASLRSRTLTPGPPTYYRLDEFLENGEAHVPSERLRATLALYHQLSERAQQLGLRSWQLLPQADLPPSWREVQTLKKFTYATEN